MIVVAEESFWRATVVAVLVVFFFLSVGSFKDVWKVRVGAEGDGMMDSINSCGDINGAFGGDNGCCDCFVAVATVEVV